MKGAAKMKENKTIKIITMITGILTVLLGFYAVVRPMRTFWQSDGFLECFSS